MDEIEALKKIQTEIAAHGEALRKFQAALDASSQKLREDIDAAFAKFSADVTRAALPPKE